jgi:CheY-like chemotaxis protein
VTAPSPTILNVDDSEDDVVMLRAACTSARVAFQLQAANSGADALLYLQGAQSYADRERFPFPALVLLDLKMPGTSGFEVLQALRSPKHESLRRLPIVIFTSSMHDEDATRAFQLGADAYLVKPSDFDELRRVVTTLDSILSRAEPDLSDLRNLPDTKLATATT